MEAQTHALRWLLLLAGLIAAILLPWAIIGNDLSVWVAQAVAALAGRPWLVAALVVGLLALDPLLPVPSSIVALAAGSALGTAMGALAIWIGLMAGVVIGYWLGRRPGRALADRLIGAPALAGLDPHARPLGPLALVLSRPVPVLAEAVIILAGTARLKFWHVLASTAPANAGVALLWGGLGAAGLIGPALIGAVAVPALAFAIWQYPRRPS